MRRAAASAAAFFLTLHLSSFRLVGRPLPRKTVCMAVTGRAVLTVLVDPAGVVRETRAVLPVVHRLGVAGLADAVAGAVAVRERMRARIAPEADIALGVVGCPDLRPYGLRVDPAVRLVAGQAVPAPVRRFGMAVGAEPV